MIRPYLVCVPLLLGFTTACSQNAPVDTLSVKDGFFGPTYKEGSRELSSKEFKDLLRACRDTTVPQLYASGSTLSTLGDVSGFVGGFCIGFGAFSKPAKTGTIVVGVVIAAAAIVLDLTGEHKMQEALVRYNHPNQGVAGGPDLLHMGPDSPLVSFEIQI